MQKLCGFIALLECYRARYDSVFLTSISDFSIGHDKMVGQNFNAVLTSFFCIQQEY